MNIIECTYVTFHAPVFLSGTNLGEKIDTSKRSDIKLFYNVSLRMIFIEFKGQIAFTDTFHVAVPKNQNFETWGEPSPMVDTQPDKNPPETVTPKAAKAPKAPKVQTYTTNDHAKQD